MRNRAILCLLVVLPAMEQPAAQPVAKPTATESAQATKLLHDRLGTRSAGVARSGQSPNTFHGWRAPTEVIDSLAMTVQKTAARVAAGREARRGGGRVARSWPVLRYRPAAVRIPSSVQRPPVVQQRPTVVQQRPPVVQQRPTVVQQRPTVVQQRPKAVQQRPTVVQQRPKAVQQRPKGVQQRPTVQLPVLPAAPNNGADPAPTDTAGDNSSNVLNTTGGPVTDIHRTDIYTMDNTTDTNRTDINESDMKETDSSEADIDGANNDETDTITTSTTGRSTTSTTSTTARSTTSTTDRSTTSRSTISTTYRSSTFSTTRRSAVSAPEISEIYRILRESHLRAIHGGSPPSSTPSYERTPPDYHQYDRNRAEKAGGKSVVSTIAWSVGTSLLLLAIGGLVKQSRKKRETRAVGPAVRMTSITGQAGRPSGSQAARPPAQVAQLSASQIGRPSRSQGRRPSGGQRSALAVQTNNKVYCVCVSG